MTTDILETLKVAIESQHGCQAAFLQSVPVKEVFEGKTVWEGIVSVFDLTGHPMSSRAYAWSHPVTGSTKHRYYIVLRAPGVDTPQAAVRAAIVAERRL